MTSPPMDPSRRRLLGAAAPAALLLNGSFASSARAQSGPFPNHPIELIVPWQAGGGADVIGRSFASAVAGHLPQPVVVVNRPGATGALGLGSVVSAKPDGYKIVLSTPEITFLNHLGLAKFSYQDMLPIARLNGDPCTIAVGPDAPWNTLEQFLEAARKPDANISVGNSGIGSTYHLATAALADKTGTKYNNIPFAGGAPAILALLGGHINAVIVTTAETSSYVMAGKLKALGVMADKRVTDGFENVPTLKERGIDLSMGLWRGLNAPRETPDNVMAVLRTATAQAVKESVWIDSLKKLHFSTDTYLDAAAFQTAMDKDSALFKTLASKVSLT